MTSLSHLVGRTVTTQTGKVEQTTSGSYKINMHILIPLRKHMQSLKKIHWKFIGDVEGTY